MDMGRFEGGREEEEEEEAKNKPVSPSLDDSSGSNDNNAREGKGKATASTAAASASAVDRKAIKRPPASKPRASAASSSSSPAEKQSPKKRKTKSKSKRASKKPKDMPRRPMSAYNFFFQEQRSKMLEEARRRQMLGQDRDSKIGFENMAKLVARRWRELGPEDLGPYQKLAADDMERYRVEMNEYQTKLARRCRLEREEAGGSDNPATTGPGGPAAAAAESSAQPEPAQEPVPASASSTADAGSSVGLLSSSNSSSVQPPAPADPSSHSLIQPAGLPQQNLDALLAALVAPQLGQQSQLGLGQQQPITNFGNQQAFYPNILGTLLPSMVPSQPPVNQFLAQLMGQQPQQASYPIVPTQPPTGPFLPGVSALLGGGGGAPMPVSLMSQPNSQQQNGQATGLSNEQLVQLLLQNQAPGGSTKNDQQQLGP